MVGRVKAFVDCICFTGCSCDPVGKRNSYLIMKKSFSMNTCVTMYCERSHISKIGAWPSEERG